MSDSNWSAVSKLEIQCPKIDCARLASPRADAKFSYPTGYAGRFITRRIGILTPQLPILPCNHTRLQEGDWMALWKLLDGPNRLDAMALCLNPVALGFSR